MLLGRLGGRWYKAGGIDLPRVISTCRLRMQMMRGGNIFPFVELIDKQTKPDELIQFLHLNSAEGMFRKYLARFFHDAVIYHMRPTFIF